MECSFRWLDAPEVLWDSVEGVLPTPDGLEFLNIPLMGGLPVFSHPPLMGYPLRRVEENFAGFLLLEKATFESAHFGGLKWGRSLKQEAEEFGQCFGSHFDFRFVFSRRCFGVSRRGSFVSGGVSCSI